MPTMTALILCTAESFSVDFVRCSVMNLTSHSALSSLPCACRCLCVFSLSLVMMLITLIIY